MGMGPRGGRGAAVTLLSLAVSACGGGGGGGGGAPALSLEFTGGTSTVAEDGGAVTVLVELNSTVGPLQEDVTVTVQDTGSGTATAGTDYVTFTPQTVTFAAGSASGSVRSVVLHTLSDNLVEGPETVTLQMVDVSGGATPMGLTHLTLQDGDLATLQFTEASQISTDESEVRVLSVQLLMDLSVQLAVDLQVEVNDGGGGTASSGVDYSGISTEILTFPAGSPSGSVAQLTLTLQDDSIMEGNETAIFQLVNPSPGARLGATKVQVITITEDDTSQNPFLAVGLGSPGGVLPAASGATLDFGTMGAGSRSAAFSVELQNLGQDPLGLAAPILIGSTYDFQVILDVSVSSGMPSLAALPVGPPGPSPLALLQAESERSATFVLDEAQAAALQGFQAITLNDFRIPGAGAVTLELQRMPSPWSGDSVIQVNGVADAAALAQVRDELSLWKGSVRDREGSAVFLGFSPGGSRGWVQLSADPASRLHLLDESAPGAGGARTLRLSFDGPDDAPSSAASYCSDVLYSAEGQVDPDELPAGALGTVGGLTAADCVLFLETDYQFYQAFGDINAAATYVTELVAALSARYSEQVQTSFSIGTLNLYSSSSDPWSTPDLPFGDPHRTVGDLLDEFQAAYAGTAWTANADLAHFLSGASLGGGIAYVNVLCNQTSGFGVSASLSGGIDWTTFDYSPSYLNWDFVVVAHELGHNFNALHTHSYNPRIDQCGSSPSVCSAGTLMSYCHLCPGGLTNISLEFHPFVANQMRTAINASCLGDASVASLDTVRYLVTFRPGSAGTRSATLRFTHNAGNQPNPFEVLLTGTGN